MKKNKLLVLAIAAIAFAGCSKKERSIYFTNNKYSTESFIFGSEQVNWSVKVIANGIDFGVLKPGETSEIRTITGSKLEITTFAPVEDCFDKSVYFKDGNTKVCLRNDTALANKFVKKYDIALNQTSYTIDVGYGSSDYLK